MKNKHLFTFVISWFALAIFLSFFVSVGTAPAVATFFIFIAILTLGAELLLRSGTFDYIISRVRGRASPGFHDNLSRTVFYIRLASRQRAYGWREIALVLREAFLSKHLGAGAFPTDWIATSGGDAALESILREKNSLDLLDIIKIPDMSAKPGSRVEKIGGRTYLSKLNRALSLIEEKS